MSRTSGKVQQEEPVGRRDRRKQANRALNRLLSIRRDAHLLKETLDLLSSTYNNPPPLPILANERCGSWYIDTSTTQICDTCYFKSTDGHTNIWNFSLKRLNLNVLRAVAEHGSRCVLVDASASKTIPDSFSRTLPIWACVLNRLVARYRQEMGGTVSARSSFMLWDTALYTPSSCVSEKEHEAMESIIEDRVWAAYESKVIVDPQWLVRTMQKPLRPTWLTPTVDYSNDYDEDSYFSLLCISCSDLGTTGDDDGGWYSPGAADDQESWARGLTPSMFWKHAGRILDEATDADAADAAIDACVRMSQSDNDDDTLKLQNDIYYDTIGELRLSIGSRRAGRPPECWKVFDAVLNVTDQSYNDEDDDNHPSGGRHYYLQLPVREGKRDKIELERWMAAGIVFVAFHASYGRRILIHCAQGKDRSVALAMAAIMVLCQDLTLPLRWRESILMTLRNEFGRKGDGDDAPYGISGLTQSNIQSLLGQQGRGLLLDCIRSELGVKAIPANKDTLRLALLLIQQDREKADPSRTTMQKLNRFFMSDIMFSP